MAIDEQIAKIIIQTKLFSKILPIDIRSKSTSRSIRRIVKKS